MNLVMFWEFLLFISKGFLFKDLPFGWDIIPINHCLLLMCCVTATRTVNLFLITLGLMHTEVLVDDIILSSSLVFLSPLSLDLGFSPVTLLSKTKFLMLLFLPWLSWLLRYVDASYKFFTLSCQINLLSALLVATSFIFAHYLSLWSWVEQVEGERLLSEDWNAVPLEESWLQKVIDFFFNNDHCDCCGYVLRGFGDAIWCMTDFNFVRLLMLFSFDEFLMDMKQSKRKNIRQERKKVCCFSTFHVILVINEVNLVRK